MKYIINVFRGFCMALADSVPGVSGGTIAFILGFYDKFIGSLNNLIYGKKQEKKEALFFLIKIGIGWVIGMVLAVLILSKLFQKHIYGISSLFLGFIICSIPLIIKVEKDVLKGKYINLIFTAIGIAVVVLITYFNPVAGAETTVNIGNLNIGLGLYLFLAGMVAISAMVLPGISGSTLLLIFGLYIPIVTAIKDLLHLNFECLPAIIIFGLGIIAGVLLVIKGIKIALEKFRSQTIYCVIGLMIGSLYAIVMGPTTLDIPKDPLSIETFKPLMFILGCLVIFGLEGLKRVVEKKKKTNDFGDTDNNHDK